jgi:hypothetical protein
MLQSSCNAKDRLETESVALYETVPEREEPSLFFQSIENLSMQQ